MKNIPYDSYEIILEALTDKGYTEVEAELIICDVIEDQIEFSNIADRLHSIIVEMKDRGYS